MNISWFARWSVAFREVPTQEDQESLFDLIRSDMDRDLKIGYKKASAGTNRPADAFLLFIGFQ